MEYLRQIPSGDASEVYIDVSTIPEHTIEVLAEATLQLYREILAMPNGREMLDRKIAELGLE